MPAPTVHPVRVVDTVSVWVATQNPAVPFGLQIALTLSRRLLLLGHSRKKSNWPAGCLAANSPMPLNPREIAPLPTQRTSPDQQGQ